MGEEVGGPSKLRLVNYDTGSLPKARRRPPGAGAEAAEVSGVAVEVGEGGDSSWSLMADFPSLNRIVKDTMSTATSSTFFILKLNRLFSFMIQGLERRGLRRWSMTLIMTVIVWRYRSVRWVGISLGFCLFVHFSIM